MGLRPSRSIDDSSQGEVQEPLLSLHLGDAIDLSSGDLGILIPRLDHSDFIDYEKSSHPAFSWLANAKGFWYTHPNVLSALAEKPLAQRHDTELYLSNLPFDILSLPEHEPDSFQYNYPVTFSGDLRRKHNGQFPQEYINPYLVATLVDLYKVSKARKLKFKGLSSLLTLPLDIILEIFSNLHPIYLISLSRANKELHALLNSPANKSIWQDSFIYHPELPICPDQGKERQWALHIFGQDMSCSYCRDGPCKDLRLEVRRRVCGPCTSKGLSLEDHGPTFYVENNPSGSHFDVCYLKDDQPIDRDAVLGIIKQNETEEVRIRFESDKSLLDAMTNCCKIQRKLFDHRYHWRHIPNSRSSYSRFPGKLWERKLVLFTHYNLPSGSFHRSRPYDYMDLLAPMLRKSNLTPRQTLQMEDCLRPLLTQSRLKQEKEQELKSSRNIQLRNFVQECIPPDQWHNLPDVSIFHERFPRFDESKSKFTKHGPFSIKKDIKAFFYAFSHQARLAIWRMAVSSNDIFPFETDSIEMGNDLLACMVFVLSNGDQTKIFPCLIGWDDVSPHLHRGGQVHLLRDASRMACHIVKLAGLDQASAMPADMDLVNKRFVCDNCKPMKRRYAFTWREAIFHYMTVPKTCMERSTEIGKFWSVLTTEATQHIIRIERPLRVGRWACVHCTSPLRITLSSKSQVDDHLRSVHRISRGVENRDYASVGWHNWTARRPAMIIVDGSQKLYRCNLCSEPVSSRLFTQEGIEMHVAQKHPGSKVGVTHWTAVPVFASTPLDS